MKSKTIFVPEIKLIGIKAFTSNKAEFNSDTAKIKPTIDSYMKNFAGKNANLLNNGKFYSVYSEYESDHNGAYTYLFGEEVSNFNEAMVDLSTYTIPAQTYKVFTTQPGSMPNVVIQAWQEIWQMNEDDFGGKRAYIADFEVYDHRSYDPSNAVVDIYIGIK